MKNKIIILLLAALYAGMAGQAQSVNPEIVLLKNNDNLLPFKQLEQKEIGAYNSELTRFCQRYTQNQGNQQIYITNGKGEQPANAKLVLVLVGGQQPASIDTAVYDAIIYAQDGQKQTLDLLSQKLFGGRAFTSRLSKQVLGYQAGQGLTTKGNLRFSFGAPAEVQMDSAYLYHTLDSIITWAINSGVAPGIQVLVARNGRVVYHKTHGYLTYDNKEPVQKHLLYDFASVTKITGALPVLMQLYDQNKFSLDATMGTYLPYFAKGNKKNLVYRQVLSHNARLKPWIPYWQSTLKKNGTFKRHTLSHDSSATYPNKLAPNLYLYKNFKQTIYKQIRKSPLNEKPGYVYSGLSFYLYPQIIENLTGADFETYVKEHIYRPLGASSITYNPARFYPIDSMVPTEIDTFFRKMPLRGVVHDEGAAMMLGVSSNAGLFGTTLDLAKIMQMYLWRGRYGGRQYISANTMELFTSCHYCNQGNRRGLGFDKPVLSDKANGSTALDASPHSFGHAGYTGTFAWADPDTGLLFIFMSNRVYPTRNNRKLYQLNVRPLLHQVLYDAINKYKTAGMSQKR